MKIEKLVQRKLFVKRELELKEKGLNYRFKNLTSSFELEIPYEEIGTKRINQTQANNGMIFFAIFMCIASFAKTFYLFKGEHNDYIFTAVVLGIFIFSVFLTYYGYKNYILIEAVNPPFIELYANRPNMENVEDFIIEMHKRAKQYLIKKYAERDMNVSLESQLEMLSVLKNRNIINNEEYDELTVRLTKPKNNPIGFGI